VQNLSIALPQKTTIAVARRPARASSAQLLERVLGAAEDAILDSSEADAVLAQLGGRPYRVRLRALDGHAHVIVAIVDSAAAALLTVPELRARFGFTDREAEVARLLAARLTNKEIARTLGVTAYTAERHTERILAKLGINSRRHVHGMIAAAG
jgi:DNA-binding CsgD family transcriptional regulator